MFYGVTLAASLLDELPSSAKCNTICECLLFHRKHRVDVSIQLFVLYATAYQSLSILFAFMSYCFH